MSERVPFGKITRTRRTPRRRMLVITASELPSNGCRSRVTTTDLGRSWGWVVCRVFLREHSACRTAKVGSASDCRSARAASDQDVAGMSRGRNRRSRKEETDDRGTGQAARYPARLTHYSPYAKGNFTFDRVICGWRRALTVLDLRLKR